MMDMHSDLQQITKYEINGNAQQFRYLVKPWDINLAEIRQPVTFWRGNKDKHISDTVANKLMSSIPQATIHRFPDEGHTLFFTQWENIVKDWATGY